MADNKENSVLELLRSIRATQDEVNERLKSIENRVLLLETQMTGLHSTNAEFRIRFERIEQRLQL